MPEAEAGEPKAPEDTAELPAIPEAIAGMPAVTAAPATILFLMNFLRVDIIIIS
jgi:hypothetical protein